MTRFSTAGNTQQLRRFPPSGRRSEDCSRTLFPRLLPHPRPAETSARISKLKQADTDRLGECTVGLKVAWGRAPWPPSPIILE